MVKINIGEKQVDLSAGQLSREVKFSVLKGRKFTFDGKEQSLNNIMKTVLGSSKKITPKDLAEIKATFLELENAGYGEKEKLENADWFTQIVAKTKHAIGSQQRKSLFKEINKLEQELLTDAQKNNNYIVLGECVEYGIGDLNKSPGLAEEYYNEARKAKSPEALLHLGNLYLKQNKNDAAFKAFQEAAKLGDPEGMYMVGYCHENEIGTTESWNSLKHYQSAADKGNAKAQYKVGEYNLYLDKPKALKYLNFASNQGNVEAKIKLGMNAESEQDFEKATEYYQFAADHGNAEGQYRMGDIIIRNSQYSHWLENEKSPEFKEVFRYYSLSAKQGFPVAETALARYYEYKKPPDLEKAFKFYESAAAHDKNGAAPFSLARCYEKGIGCDTNPQAAFKIFSDVSKSKSSFYSHWAANELARCYENGIGTPKNPEKAFENYKLSAEKGLDRSYMDLGRCYENGIGTDVDPKKAFETYKLAEEKNVREAYSELARCYEKGIGTEINLLAADEYHKKAYPFWGTHG